MPETSVILSTHNNAAFLAAAIDSILGQTYQDFELIVVDDGSTDDTQAVLAMYNDQRVRVLVNPTQQGLPRSLNHALVAAQGEFIARMDGDDVVHPERLAHQLAYLKQQPSVGSLGTQVVRIDTNNREIGGYPHLPLKHSLIAWHLFLDVAILHATTVTRRSVLDTVGHYNPVYPVTEDLDLWLRLLFVTRFANLPQKLYHYRRHHHSVTQRNAQQLKTSQYEIRAKVATRLLGTEISPQTIARLAHPNTVDPQQAEVAATLLMALYDAMDSAGLFLDDEHVLVQADMEQRLSRISAMTL